MERVSMATPSRSQSSTSRLFCKRTDNSAFGTEACAGSAAVSVCLYEPAASAGRFKRRLRLQVEQKLAMVSLLYQSGTPHDRIDDSGALARAPLGSSRAETKRLRRAESLRAALEETSMQL